MNSLIRLLSAVQKAGIVPRKTSLYRAAMTHSSYANEHSGSAGDNERLEFLGDAVLSMIVSEHLFGAAGDPSEGLLTRTRARVVCEPTLAEAAGALGLGEHLRLGRGEEATGGRTKQSILADAFEALVAAVYLDAGLDATRRFVREYLLDRIDTTPGNFTDHKTALQEIVQSGSAARRVTYEVVSQDGPDHERHFVVDALIDGAVAGRGTGRNRRQAEQEAARDAISRMEKGSV